MSSSQAIIVVIGIGNTKIVRSLVAHFLLCRIASIQSIWVTSTCFPIGLFDFVNFLLAVFCQLPVLEHVTIVLAQDPCCAYRADQISVAAVSTYEYTIPRIPLVFFCIFRCLFATRSPLSFKQKPKACKVFYSDDIRRITGGHEVATSRILVISAPATLSGNYDHD